LSGLEGEMPNSPRLLADNHPLILNALGSSLVWKKDFQVLARCGDGEETLKACTTISQDVLILDLRMPGKDGLAVLERCGKSSAHTGCSY